MTALETVAQILGVTPDTLEGRHGLLNHPRWDSQAHVEIMAWLNASHGVAFTEDNMHRFSVLQAILDHCEAP